jgi:hypothetical protein
MDERAFNHINEQRMKNENHDVILNFLINLRLIEHSLDLEDDTVIVPNRNAAMGKKKSV